MRISKKMLHALSSMYVGEKISITTSCGTSEPFDVNHGLKEGSVLSPILFILMMSDLPTKFQAVVAAEEANQTKPPRVNGILVPVLSYANDNVLLNCLLAGLRRYVAIFEEYCHSMILQVNPPKTELIYFQQRSRKRTTTTSITVCSTEVKCTSSAKYLGVTIPCGRRHYENVKETKLKSMSAAVGCLKMVAKVGIKDLGLALKFYKAFISSVIKYALSANS
jgi:hypothetical protein